MDEDMPGGLLRMGDSRLTQLRRVKGIEAQEPDPNGDTLYLRIDGEINERLIRERGLIVHRRGAVLTCANVQDIAPHDPSKWTLTPWRPLNSNTEYEEGLTLCFGLEHKHLPQM